MRGGVSRVRIREARSRTVIRNTAEQDTARATSLLIEIQTAYAVWGIKQRRDPMYALASEGAAFERADARPAGAP